MVENVSGVQSVLSVKSVDRTKPWRVERSYLVESLELREVGKCGQSPKVVR